MAREREQIPGISTEDLEATYTRPPQRMFEEQWCPPSPEIIVGGRVCYFNRGALPAHITIWSEPEGAGGVVLLKNGQWYAGHEGACHVDAAAFLDQESAIAFAKEQAARGVTRLDPAGEIVAMVK